MAHQRGRYYYRSRREGGRVVTDYLGSGDQGRIIAELDSLDERRRREERQQVREQQECERRHDECANAVGDLIRTMADAVLLSEGYHTHKGTWRRTRRQRKQ